MRAAIRQALKPRRPSPEQLVWLIRILVVLAVVILILILLSEVGIVRITRRNGPIVAAMLALTGVLSGHLVNTWLENRRAREAHDLENRRLQEAREAREQEAERTALQKYLEQMWELIQQGLRESSHIGDQKRMLARAQTQVVLGGLDSRNKRPLLDFLYNTGLINRHHPIIDLSHADFHGGEFSEYSPVGTLGIDRSETSKYLGDANPGEYLTKDNLTGVLQNIAAGPDDLWNFLTHWNIRVIDLSEADLPKVDMSKAFLRQCWLRGANLRDSFLTEADLIGADLSNACLREASLNEAVLLGAILNRTDLTDAFLQGAVLAGAQLVGADMSGANASTAVLYGATLNSANLSSANLSGADLNRAELVGADLSEADLSEATVDQMQMETAWSLNYATMPDGSVHD